MRIGFGRSDCFVIGFCFLNCLFIYSFIFNIHFFPYVAFAFAFSLTSMISLENQSKVL